METLINNQQNQPSVNTTPAPVMPDVTPKKRNYLPWILGILVLVVFLVTFFLILIGKSKPIPTESLIQESSPSGSIQPPVSSYNQILEDVKYSSLSKKFGNTLPIEAELSLLQSKEFPFTLKYPKGYYLNYIGPSKNYPKTTIFISPDLNDKEGIDYIVRCEKDDSTLGICRESVPPYLEIVIGQETNITDQDPEFSPASQYSTPEFVYANVFVVTTIDPHGNLDGTETYNYHFEYRRQIKNFSQITMDIVTASNPATHPDILKAIIVITQSFALSDGLDGSNGS